jgi:hypothetical protein
MQSDAVGRTSKRPKKNYSFYRVSKRWGLMSLSAFRGQCAQRVALGEITKKRAKELYLKAKYDNDLGTVIETYIAEHRVDWYDPDNPNTASAKYCIKGTALHKLLALMYDVPVHERPVNVEIHSPLGDIVYRHTRVEFWRKINRLEKSILQLSREERTLLIQGERAARKQRYQRVPNWIDDSTWIDVLHNYPMYAQMTPDQQEALKKAMRKTIIAQIKKRE